MTQPFPNLPKPVVVVQHVTNRTVSIELNEKQLIDFLKAQFETRLLPAALHGEPTPEWASEVSFDCGDGYLKGVTITVTSTQERTE